MTDPGPTKRVILLDRDGVLNRDRPDSIRRPDQVILLPQSGAAVAQLARAGFRVLVITNQAAVGKGWVTPATLAQIHERLSALVRAEGGTIDAFYVCPHRVEEQCGCRKPATGLIDRAQAEWGFDRAATWMVGDKLIDAQTALHAGCRPALVLTGKGEGVRATPDIPVFADLWAFVQSVC